MSSIASTYHYRTAYSTLLTSTLQAMRTESVTLIILLEEPMLLLSGNSTRQLKFVVCPLLINFLQQGCSVQILNPQSYSKEMWLLGATLQELFGSFTGANVYALIPVATHLTIT